MGSESLSDVLARAGANAVLGIGVVFSVLLIICLIIFCFKIFPIIEGRMNANKAADTNVPATRATTVATNDAAVDDGELIAVIAAAIAASTGQSTDSFVVRSIKRRF